MTIAVDTINKTIADADAGKAIYVEDYVSVTYASDVASAKALYNKLTKEQQSAFYSKLATEIPSYLVDELLKIMFGIDDPTKLYPKK